MGVEENRQQAQREPEIKPFIFLQAGTGGVKKKGKQSKGKKSKSLFAARSAAGKNIGIKMKINRCVVWCVWSPPPLNFG